jgi:hypothetical protein
LEKTLSAACIILVGLTGEFFAVEAKHISGIQREETVVIILNRHFGDGPRRFERFETFDAKSASAVEMHAATLRAGVKIFAGPDETQMSSEEHPGLCWIADLSTVQ